MIDIREMAEPRDPDPVRRRTPEELNARIDHAAARRVSDCASKSHLEIACDIGVLEQEWDLERALGLAVSVLILPGVALVAGGKRAGVLLPAVAAVFCVQQALTGFSAPVRLLRRLGLRTRREIDCEKFALKSLRGDFGGVLSAGSVVARAGRAVQAATL